MLILGLVRCGHCGAEAAVVQAAEPLVSASQHVQRCHRCVPMVRFDPSVAHGVRA